MRLRTISRLALSGLIAGAAATAGCATTASTATSRPATRTASTRTASARSTSGTTRILAYSVNSDGPRFHAIVTGAVGDYGPALTVLPDGKADPQHTSELELNLRRGSSRVSIARADKLVVRAFRHWRCNLATSSGSIAVSAPAPVVAGTGTGAYRGITGSFTLTITIDEVDVPRPPCNASSKFLSQVIFMSATGKVSR